MNPEIGVTELSKLEWNTQCILLIKTDMNECDDVIVSNIGLVYILMTYKQCNDYYAFLFVEPLSLLQ